MRRAPSARALLEQPRHRPRDRRDRARRARRTRSRSRRIGSRARRRRPQFPAGFAGRTLMALVPDSLGYVAPNRAGSWRDVGYQRGAMLVLVDAAARADTVAAERAWRAIDVAFAHQHPPGGFDTRATFGRGGLDRRGDGRRGRVARGRLPRVRGGDEQPTPRPLPLALRAAQAQAATLGRSSSSGTMTSCWPRTPGILTRCSRSPRRSCSPDGTYHDPRYGSAGQQALVQALALPAQRTARSRPRDARTSRVTRRHSARSSRW